MSTSLASVGAITLFVDDAKRSKVFYEHVFDVSPIYEDDVSAAFRFGETVVNLLARAAAGTLIAPAAVGVPGEGAQVQLTIPVEDADAASAQVRARGVELLNGPMDREWGVRTAAFADPDGHVWELAQEL